MFRFSFRPYLAMVLLLCFVRVQLPEAALLALHPHQHTEHEQTQQASWTKGKALVGEQHKHCHAEQLFDTPFQPEAPLRLPAPPAAAPRYAALRPAAVQPVLARPLRGVALRGPPQA